MRKKPGFRPSLTYNFLSLFKEQKINTIITHNYSPLRYATIANLFYGNIPLIHVHHARSFEQKDCNVISERFLSKFSEKVVAVSSQLRADIIEHDKINEDKVCVIANGIDEGNYNVFVDVEEKKKSLGICSDTFVLGCCARLAEQKGHIYLLQALAEVRNRTKLNWQLLLVGDGPLKKELQNAAINLGISDRVSFLGARMDVPELLKVMDVFLLTSIWEGMPLTILEAMAAGKAIIGTNVGGVPEVLENEVNGLLVPPRDIKAIASAIERMMDSEVFRKKISANAYEKFLEEFSLKHTLDKYELLLSTPHSIK